MKKPLTLVQRKNESSYFFKFKFREFLSDPTIRDMDPEELGWLVMLLSESCIRDGKLPDNPKKLALLARCTDASRLEPFVNAFFVSNGDGTVSPTIFGLNVEFQKLETARQKMSQGGLRSAKKREELFGSAQPKAKENVQQQRISEGERLRDHLQRAAAR